MKKIFLTLLTILLCLSMIVSCSKPTSPLPNDTEKLTEDTQSEKTETKATESNSTESETLEKEDTSVHSDHIYDNACDADCNECKTIRKVSDHVYDNFCDADCNECKTIRKVPNHVYDNDCDADCNECKQIREVSNHIYDNACDTDCNECKAIRKASDHVYDNACDADCNECKEIRKVPNHVYDNFCDVDCNECKQIREVPNHVYDNDCDADCNECKAIREVSNHIYDNACDVDCNECKLIREVPNHIYDNACDADCNECKEIRKVPNHVYDNFCDVDCNECKAIREVPNHVYDNDCDVDCNECKEIRKVPDHVYDNFCDVDCNECKAIREVPNHVYDNACDVDCNECKAIREVSNHIYDNDCDVDCNECKAIREVSNHIYDNDCDADCNECKQIRKVPDHVYDNDFDVDCNKCQAIRKLSDRVVTVAPTNFASVFSEENEALLAKILNSPIQTGVDLEFLLPSMPIAYDVKEPSGNGGYTYVYYGYDKSVYDKCCQRMIDASYAQYSKNEISGKAYNNSSVTVKNYFATFISAKAQVDLEYHESVKRMYIHINARSASVLRPREAQSYVRAGDKFPTIFVQYGLEDIDTGTQKESSMGYIMRLDDGTFLIIDGGEYYDGVEVRIYDILKSLAPDPNNIVICAWILTHGHYDHVGGFMKFADKYYNDATIKVKQVVTNFPDDSNCLNNPERSAHSYVRSATAKLKAETLKPHTGNVLYYADIKINILYTQENYLACNADGIMKEYNASSMVMQIETAAKTKIFIAADHPVNGSYEGANWCEGALYVWYGTALQSYVTTTFHHGFGGGADNIIYTVIDARITLWDCDYDRAQDVASYECNQFFLDRSATSIYQCYGAFGSSITILSFNNHMAFATYFPNFPTYQTSMHKIYQ